MSRQVNDEANEWALNSVKLTSFSFMFQKMSYNDYDSEDAESNLDYSEDEYNSEDDEFLAFHDADIEAQVVFF